jgi:alkylation response protein AidB-like acyl-CoA dehydrogenase
LLFSLLPIITLGRVDTDKTLADSVIQIHDSMGCINGTNLAQYLRYIITAVIHEGTNGIREKEPDGRKVAPGNSEH